MQTLLNPCLCPLLFQRDQGAFYMSMDVTSPFTNYGVKECKRLFPPIDNLVACSQSLRCSFSVELFADSDEDQSDHDGLVKALMGTLNSRVQFVQTPIAGVALSHLRILRLRSGIVISFGNSFTSGFLLGGSVR